MRTKEAILEDSSKGYHERATLDTFIDIRDILATIAGLLAQMNARQEAEKEDSK